MSAVVTGADLGRAAELWHEGLEDRYRHYLSIDPTREPYALAAALVETALELQGISAGAAATVTPLLLGDLCLSKASRLLVDHADQATQVAFARVVEAAAAVAAAEQKPVDVRARLTAVLEHTA